VSLHSPFYSSLIRSLWAGIIGLASLALPSLAEPTLEDAFRDPAPADHPFVRWWWNGNRVNTPEAIRQLDVMQAAGIGGVEINSIAMPDAVPTAGLDAFPQHRWLSPEWGQIVREVSEAAQARGMTVDIIMGSGWPFGGEFIPLEDQIQRVRLVKRSFTGPAEIDVAIADLHLDEQDGTNHESAWDIVPPRRELLSLRLRKSGAMDFGQELLDEPSPLPERLSFSVPAGKHTLYIVALEQGFTEVKHGAPGAAGPIVDHYNPAAVRRYLDHVSAGFEQATQRSWADLVRAVFVDSLELSRSNWTTGFAETFAREKGYELNTYLPLLLDLTDDDLPPPLAETVQRARYDFSQLLVDTFETAFLRTFDDWAREHGIQARSQAYGRETHPLHGSMSIALPEGESWLWNDSLTNRDILVDSTAVNSYVGSAARLVGQRRVSFEAMTNAVPAFRETMADFKQTLDQTLLDGVSHPILHGFNYTPPEAGFPGWVRFGCYFNERSPWWMHLLHFSTYSARMTTLLQAGEIEARIALLGPRADELGRLGMLYQPFPETRYPWYHYAIAEAFRQAGYGVDFVSERILQSASVEAGMIRFADRQYDAVVLLDVESVELATAVALRRFTTEGVALATVGAVPHRHSGLDATGQKDLAVQDETARIASGQWFRFAAPIKPASPYPADQRGLPDHDQALIDLALEIGQATGASPSVRFSHPQMALSQLRLRLDDGRDAVLLVNFSRDQTIETEVFVPRAAGAAHEWNADTGLITPYAASQGTRAQVRLSPLESTVLVWDPAVDSDHDNKAVLATREAVAIPLAGWSLAFVNVDDSGDFFLDVETLSDLSLHDDPTISDFAGTITYRTTFEVDSAEDFQLLNLGTVHGSVSVSLNGTPLGDRWYGQPEFDVAGILQSGRNVLEITLATHLANHLNAQKEDPMAQRWTFWYSPIPVGLLGPVHGVRLN